MYDINNTDFTKLLAKYRKSRGITLENLGNKIGKTKATVSKYENGEIIPDIVTILEICNALNITLSQLFPISTNEYNNYFSINPFKVQKLYLYYYSENVLITSVLELKEEKGKTLVNFYNGIKNINNYANETSYYYEGILECDKIIGYINLYNHASHKILLEKIQISFLIPWSQNLKFTNFFILALTPNSIPVVKKGIISIEPIVNISNYMNSLKITQNDITKMQHDNSWILENKNYDYFLFN